MKKALSIYRNCVVLLFLLQFVSNCSPEDDGGSGEEEVQEANVVEEVTACSSAKRSEARAIRVVSPQMNSSDGLNVLLPLMLVYF